MKNILSIILFIIALPINITSTLASDEVNVYSARKEHLIKPLINDFEIQTGIKVNILSAKILMTKNLELFSVEKISASFRQILV